MRLSPPRFSHSVFVLAILVSVSPPMLFGGEGVSLKSGRLGLELDSTGRVTALTDLATKKNYLTDKQKSYLIQCYMYGDMKKRLAPKSMTVREKTSDGVVLEFAYPGGASLTVGIKRHSKGYFKMELLDAKPLKEIYKINWGPYKTKMRGPIARWLGFNRSDDFTLGLLSLEPNTDGEHGYDPCSANYESYGSRFYLASLDHARPMEFRKWRTSKPIPVTVKGSKAALFGVPRGRDSELDMIEAVELAEGLPHPMFLGKWNKRTRDVQRLSLWIGINAKNSDECLKLAQEMSAGTVCRFHGYFANWGHFDIDKNIFPGGRAAIKKISEKAWGMGRIVNTTYTLSGFLKPMSASEPFLTPKPDDRLAAWDPVTSTVSAVSADAKEFEVKLVAGLLEVFKQSHWKVVRVGDEMVEFKSFEKKGDAVLLKEAERGAFKTVAAAHKPGTKVRCMHVSGYHNFYPGTVAMNNEMASYIAKDAVGCGNGVVILDGYESCFETGHSEYALNMFAKTIYDMGGQKNRLMAYSLTQGNYNWHMMSYQSWGEYNLEQGFRGTMIDYRIMRQIQYRDNLVPNKMGQYYPNNATLEDIEWLMARVCGWDAGVDFNLGLQIRKNPDYKAICQALRLWNKARSENLFTARQKLELRQTDRLYHLSEDGNGHVKLEFKGFWRHPGLKISPPSSFKMEASKKDSTAPCSIDWRWTHNPGIFTEVGLTDDMVASSTKPGQWTVTYPTVPDKRINKDAYMLPVLRVPSDSPCGIKNIRVGANGCELVIPVELAPGEYISFPHRLNWGCVYDSKTHMVKREFRAVQSNPYWAIPKLKRGQASKISLKFEPVKAGAVPTAKLNLWFYNPILPN